MAPGGIERATLTGHGYFVADARSGEEALDKLTAERFDLVLAVQRDRSAHVVLRALSTVALIGLFAMLPWAVAGGMRMEVNP